MTTTALRLSVVIPTYQRCQAVRRVLIALTRQVFPAEAFEVIVVLDGSTDGTAEMIGARRWPYVVRMFRQPNRGRAAARNAGIAHAGGELLVFIDDDMEPGEGFLDAHARAHAGHDQRCVLGAVPIVSDPGAAPATQYIGHKFNQHLEQLAHPGHVLRLRDFYSGNFSIRRDVLLFAGAFDERFKLYGNEDVELALRLEKNGVEWVFSPDALARQHYTKGFADLAGDTIAKGHTTIMLTLKHPEVSGELLRGRAASSSLQWRIVRACGVFISRYCRRLPSAIILVVQQLERNRPAVLTRYYHLLMDYFFWLGVDEAKGSRAASVIGHHAPLRKGNGAPCGG